MISLRIYGCKKNPYLKRKIKEASLHYVSKLMPNKKRLEVRIRLVNGLLKNNNAHGECYTTNDPYTFYVDIESKDEPEEILQTLAHEFVHIKQFSRKELIFKEDHSIWFGIVYKDGKAYQNLPWEKEARRVEKLLYESFIKDKQYK